MSIILKGIDMPTDRKPYGIEVIYRFEGADGLFSEKNYLSPNQAIQIPKGHGRLIDGDELKEKYSNWLETVPFVNNSLVDMGRRDVLISVNHDLTYSAPTILEAEGEDVHKSNV